MTATTSSQEKINWLFGLPNGATHAANYKTEDFAAIVKQVTEGKGVDVIIDLRLEILDFRVQGLIGE